MTPSFYARNDTLIIRIMGARDPLAGDAEALRPILAILETHGFAPDAIATSKAEKPFSVDAAVKLAGKRDSYGSVTLSLIRNAEPQAEMSWWFRGSRHPIQVRFGAATPLAALAAPAEAARVVDLVRSLANVIEPIYGLAHSEADYYLGSDPHQTKFDAPAQIYEPHWLTVLGKAAVDAIGHERIASTPGATVEWLAAGAVLIRLGDTPVEFARPEARRAQAAAMVHLRSATMVEELARLEARSARLAPVEPRWDPDVAELFERVADHVSFGERQIEIARLNGLHVDEPVEQRADVLPSDVEDSAKACARYETYAEQFVALLHSYVSDVGKSDPATLPAIDDHVWQFDYPTNADRRDLEQDLVPAVGGYLGQLMVDRLGGRWVPRKKLDEIQVVVGDRAWLPFARARQYLSSRDAVLTHSLTKYFRAAQRLRA